MKSECQAIFRDDARRQLLAFVGAADEVLNKQILVRRMGAEVGQQGLEMRRSHGRVVVPPHMRRRRCVAHDELVLGRAAGVLARIGHKRPVGRQPSLAAPDGLFIEGRGLEIVMHGA